MSLISSFKNLPRHGTVALLDKTCFWRVILVINRMFFYMWSLNETFKRPQCCFFMWIIQNIIWVKRQFTIILVDFELLLRLNLNRCESKQISPGQVHKTMAFILNTTDLINSSSVCGNNTWSLMGAERAQPRGNTSFMKRKTRNKQIKAS